MQTHESCRPETWQKQVGLDTPSCRAPSCIVQIHMHTHPYKLALQLGTGNYTIKTTLHMQDWLVSNPYLFHTEYIDIKKWCTGLALHIILIFLFLNSIHTNKLVISGDCNSHAPLRSLVISFLWLQHRESGCKILYLARPVRSTACSQVTSISCNITKMKMWLWLQTLPDWLFHEYVDYRISLHHSFSEKKNYG